jgi:hypothetical protein
VALTFLRDILAKTGKLADRQCLAPHQILANNKIMLIFRFFGELAAISWFLVSNLTYLIQKCYSELPKSLGATDEGSPTYPRPYGSQFISHFTNQMSSVIFILKN